MKKWWKKTAWFLGMLAVVLGITACSVDTKKDAAKDTAQDEAQDTSLRVLSFNLRMDFVLNGRLLSAASLNRIQAVQEQILSYEPDLIGFQEDVQNWIDNLVFDEENYTRYLPDEKMTSETAEYCSICVKKGINVKDSGWQWITSDKTGDSVALTYEELTDGDGEFELSMQELAELGISNNASLKEKYVDQNTRKSYGSKLAARLMNYVVIEQNGRTVLYVNTHFQHRGYNNKSYDEHPLYKLRYYERCAQFQMLQEKISQLQVQYPDAAVILTGDFNDTQDSEFYTYVSEFYTDSKRVAKSDESPDNTWNAAYNNDKQGQGYTASNEGEIVNRIDFCFVSEELKEQVESYQVGECYWILEQATATLGENIKVYPSDHLPVVVDLRLEKEE